MGRVYRARQRRLNRVVCIKMLLPQYVVDPSVARRFEKEALTTAALSHPNIVSVYDVGRSPDGAPFIVMELVEGRTLRTVLREESPVSLERAVRLMDQVLAALGEAHTHGVVHRDLKPGNVLVVGLRDGGELCKVVDFGIARMTTESEDPLTRTGVLLGTPGYMAPEQISGEDYDHRVDLYAAGVLLYELVTGKRLYRAGNEHELLKKVLLESPQPPSTRTPTHIPEQLDHICLKALSREARGRFSTASEFREALSVVLRSMPGDSPPLVFSSPSRVEYTPLAVAVPEEQSQTNTRSLLSAVLASSDEWERARLLEPFERSMRESLTSGEFDAARSAVLALQDVQRERGTNDNLKAVVETTRALLIDLVPTLVEALEHLRRGPAAEWFLRVLGRSSLPTLAAVMPGLSSVQQKLLAAVLRKIDPDLTALTPLVRTVEPRVLRPLLLAIREWPEDQPVALFSSALQSSDGALRQQALECLDERLAFRLGPVVRQRLHDPVAAVRGEALRWVFRLEDEAAVAELGRLLERPALAPAERRAVWRTLAHLKSEPAVTLLLGAFDRTTEADAVGELAALLVRTGSTRAVETVRRAADRASGAPRVQRALTEALRGVP